MLRLLKLFVILGVIGFVGLVGFAYLGDLTPDQKVVSESLTLDVD